MSKKTKKAMSMLLVVALIAVIAIGGMLAYLTDRDSEANVFTVGDVEIDLTEKFDQGATLTPGVDIEKEVKVVNTGKNDAWVWVTIAVPAALDNDDASKNVLHFNYSKDSVGAGYWNWKKDGVWNVEKNKDIDGVLYNEYTVMYETALAAGAETAYPAMTKVYLDTALDITPEGEWYKVVNGNATKVEGWDNASGNPIVYVSAYAMQVEEFANVQEAYAAYQTQWGDNGAEYSQPALTAAEALAENKGVYEMGADAVLTDEALFHNYTATEEYTINGNGNTFSGVATSVDAFQWEGGTIPAMSSIFSSANGSKVTVNDLTFTGTMSSVMAGHYQNATYNNYNTEFNNVNIVDAEVVSFSAGVSPALCAYGTLVMNDCNVYGTTLSPLDTDPMWPVYDVAAVNYSDVTLKDCKVGSVYMWNQAKVTVADGTAVDTIIVRGNMNPPKYGLIVEAGATVGTIDLSNITTATRINITIEDGATVGAFVDNGVEYATIDAWKAAQ